MRSNRLQVCNLLKSDSNRLRINIYDPIPVVRFTRRDDPIRFNIEKVRLYKKLVEFDRKSFSI